MNKKIFLILLLLPVLLIPVLILPGYTQEDNSCQEAIMVINEKYMSILNRPNVSDNAKWYVAGLIYGLHYVEKDCNTAKEKMDEILDDLWDGQKEDGGKYGYATTGISDKISTGIRFVKNSLD